MPILYTLLGIVLLIVLLFSVRIHMTIDYGQTLRAELRWLFLRYPLYPVPEKRRVKKKEKEKKKALKEEAKKVKDEAKKAKEEAIRAKKEAPAEAAETETAKEAPAEAAVTEAAADAVQETPKEEVKEEKKDAPKKKKDNILVSFYERQGIGGVMGLLRRTLDGLGGFFGRLWRTITVHELYVDMTVAGSDAAQAAIRYGKLCGTFYPMLGEILSKMRVRKYDATLVPDFLAPKSSAALYCRLSVKPIAITNATVILLVQLLLKVLVKLYKGSKDKKKKTQKSETKKGITES